MNAQDIAGDESDGINIETSIVEFLFEQEKCSNLLQTPLVSTSLIIDLGS